MGTLTTAKHDDRPNLIAIFDEATNVIDFGLIIMVFNFDTKLDRFNLLLVIASTGLFLLLLQLIAKLAIVHNSCDRRLGFFAYKHQIKLSSARTLERFAGIHDAKLLSIFSNETYLAHPNLFVDTKVFSDKLTSKKDLTLAGRMSLSLTMFAEMMLNLMMV